MTSHGLQKLELPPFMDWGKFIYLTVSQHGLCKDANISQHSFLNRRFMDLKKKHVLWDSKINSCWMNY